MNAMSVGSPHGVRERRRLDVRALDQADRHSGVGQPLRVRDASPEVGLDRRRHRPAGPRHREHGLEDPVGPGDLLGADLDPRAGRERAGDPLQPPAGAVAGLVDRDMGEVDREVRAGVDAGGQRDVRVRHRVGLAGSVTFSPKKSIELRTPPAASRRAVASASSAVAPAT